MGKHLGPKTLEPKCFTLKPKCRYQEVRKTSLRRNVSHLHLSQTCLANTLYIDVGPHYSYTHSDSGHNREVL